MSLSFLLFLFIFFLEVGVLVKIPLSTLIPYMCPQFTLHVTSPPYTFVFNKIKLYFQRYLQLQTSTRKFTLKFQPMFPTLVTSRRASLFLHYPPLRVFRSIPTCPPTTSFFSISSFGFQGILQRHLPMSFVEKVLLGVSL